jgi:formamidopyrimidine-DNA glycosylase
VPEGHLIHHYARRQRADLAGRLVRATSPQGRFAAAAAAIDGHVLRDVDADGKHLAYRCDPRVPAADLTRRRFDRLWRRLVEVMRASAERGRIVFAKTRGRRVYKRDACGRCGSAVATATVGGRTAYACRRFQR